jgi:hypothetical protein
MKTKNTLIALTAALALHNATAPAVVFTTNTTIGVGIPTYDGQPIVVSNCTLTVNGVHSFASLLLTDSAVLTHSPAPADVTKPRDIVTQAKPARAKAKDYDRQAQALYESSSKLLGLATGQNSRTEGTGLTLAVKMRDLLLALNRDQENALEPWGFTVVVGSAAPPKKKTPAA